MLVQFVGLMQSGFPNEVSSGAAQFEGYIDLGRQLSVLHVLLVECVSKVGPSRVCEVERLHRVLERIRCALTQPPPLTRQVSAPEPDAYQSLQRNIFR